MLVELPAGAAEMAATGAAQMAAAGAAEMAATFGVFRRLEVAHFDFFFLFLFICSHSYVSFCLFTVWLMSVAPNSN